MYIWSRRLKKTVSPWLLRSHVTFPANSEQAMVFISVWLKLVVDKNFAVSQCAHAWQIENLAETNFVEKFGRAKHTLSVQCVRTLRRHGPREMSTWLGQIPRVGVGFSHVWAILQVQDSVWFLKYGLFSEVFESNAEHVLFQGSGKAWVARSMGVSTCSFAQCFAFFPAGFR